MGLCAELGRLGVLFDCLEQRLLRERLGEIAVGPGEPAARAIEHAVLAREHDHRRRLELRVLLDERAGLVAVQARHHDVDEDDARLVIRNLGERVEAVLGENDFVASLAQEKLRAAPDRVAIVDHENLDRTRIALIRRSGLAHTSPLHWKSDLIFMSLAFTCTSLSEIMHLNTQLDKTTNSAAPQHSPAPLSGNEPARAAFAGLLTLDLH